MRAILVAAALMTCACATVPIPSEAVNGRVLSRDGEPIENATVELRMSLFTPLCCDWYGILQLTRTDSEGRFRFAKGADRDFQFAVESRRYSVVAVHTHYYGSFANPGPDLSLPLEIRLDPKHPAQAPGSFGCFSLCTASLAECRRAAEFHFGDKTRCDEWFRDVH